MRKALIFQEKRLICSLSTKHTEQDQLKGCEQVGGKKSQHKGRAGELELSRILRGYGYQAEPGRAVSYGTTPDVTGLPGIHIECKRAEQLRPYDWMAQAERDAVRFGDGLPAVFFRRNCQPWLVTMRLTDWLALYDRQKAAETDERKG